MIYLYCTSPHGYGYTKSQNWIPNFHEFFEQPDFDKLKLKTRSDWFVKIRNSSFTILETYIAWFDEQLSMISRKVFKLK